MISFTIDIAVRAIKLAVLRLIAPIPIISRIDPKSSKSISQSQECQKVNKLQDCIL